MNFFLKKFYTFDSMDEGNTIFILDAGNTQLKVGVFNNHQLAVTERISYQNTRLLDEFIQLHQPNAIFLSSVLSDTDTKLYFGKLNNLILFNHEIKFPFNIDYQTPQTLGRDRLANIAQAFSVNKNKNSLIVDLGTCLKFDFINQNNIYKGGSISPGIDMRYKALKHFTGKLPLLSFKEKTRVIGNSTENSIHSGVINGIYQEIKGMLTEYEVNFKDLTFFMTGGDINHFDFNTKNNTFVDENFTIKGLYQIYLFNAH
jgi:type III pantothenate kinase